MCPTPESRGSSLVIIFGLGFTGKRLARRLLSRGIPVFAAVRDAGRFGDLAAAGLRLGELAAARLPQELPCNATIFYSIPPLSPAESSRIEALVDALEPARMVYISSTGVYGDQIEVNESTPASPVDERGRLRLAAEQRISAGPWTRLILRAAAIYGPGRGVHMAIREGRLPRGSGSGVVSRIHVDDLAAIADAGIFSSLEGAWPVADDAPCSSAEIAAGYAKLLNLDLQVESDPEFVVAGRRVDGRKIREILGVELIYPSWETGLAASLAEEAAGNSKERSD